MTPVGLELSLSEGGQTAEPRLKSRGHWDRRQIILHVEQLTYYRTCVMYRNGINFLSQKAVTFHSIRQ